MAFIVIFLPLFSFFFCILFSKVLSSKLLSILSTIFISISAFLSFFLLKNIVITNKNLSIFIFKWLGSGELLTNWTITIDFLSAIMISMVTLVSFLVQFYSIGYMKNDKSVAKFFSYLSLFTFFMIFLVSSGNLLQLYFGWEGVGLCSYLLIGFWYHKNVAREAALKAFIVNRIGDLFLVLGIILIYLTFNSINFNEIFLNIENVSNQSVKFFNLEFNIITIICLFLLLGAMGKSAQLGLHTWLPDAMEGPTPVSALIHAATMVTAGVFLICKMSIFFNYSVVASNIVIFIGALTAIFAATVAITQNDIKRIIAYSTCSQLGYMFIAAGLSLYNVAIFHLITHSFFKALLFLGAGSVIHSLHNEKDIKKMGGLWKKIPLTYILMLIGSLSLSGIPFFSGYFSKEIIINSSLTSNLILSNFVYALSIFVALLTSIYSFRLIIFVFHGKAGETSRKFPNIKENSITMIFPMIILSLFAIGAGYFFKDFFVSENFVSLWINSNVIIDLNKIPHHNFFSFHSIFLTTLIFFGILFSFYIFLYNKNTVNFLISHFHKLYVFFKNKWYFDDLYENLFVKNLFKLGNNLWVFIDNGIIDKLGPNGLANITKKISRLLASFQTGYIYHYAFSLIIGMALLMTMILFFL